MYQMLTIRETVRAAKAEGLRVSEPALRRWTKTGVLRCVYAGSRCYILWADLLTLLGVEQQSKEVANGETTS